jgi:hypothetical protein
MNTIQMDSSISTVIPGSPGGVSRRGGASVAPDEHIAISDDLDCGAVQQDAAGLGDASGLLQGGPGAASAGSRMPPPRP